MEHQQRELERSQSPVSPIVPSQQGTALFPLAPAHIQRVDSHIQHEQKESDTRVPSRSSHATQTTPPIPSSPPPAYLPNPPAYSRPVDNRLNNRPTLASDIEKGAWPWSPPSRKRFTVAFAAFIFLIIAIAVVTGVTAAKAAKDQTSTHHRDHWGSFPGEIPTNTPATTATVTGEAPVRTGSAKNEID